MIFVVQWMLKSVCYLYVQCAGCVQLHVQFQNRILLYLALNYKRLSTLIYSKCTSSELELIMTTFDKHPYMFVLCPRSYHLSEDKVRVE